jgi:hypothetical protein
VIPAIIVGIGGMVSFLSPMAERAIIHGGDLSNFIMMPVAVVFFLVLPFILWFVVAGIFYVFSRFFSGTGSFPAMLQNCGYGYLPQTVLSPVVIINGIALASWSSSTPSAIPTGVIIGFGIISIFSLFWSGCLWSVAMEKTYALSRGKALFGAALVVLLYLSPLILNIIADLSASGFLIS